MEEVYKTTDRQNRHIGREEYLNPTPMQPPVGYVAAPSLIETIREQVRAYSLLQADAEVDTEEEADDFEIDDDPIDPESRWENDSIPSLKDARERIAALEQQELYFTQTTRKQATESMRPEPTPHSEAGSARTNAPGETPLTSASE